jgi:hypothetical protein
VKGEEMELATIRIIADMKTGELKKRVAEYLIDDYQDKQEYFEDLAKIPMKTLFIAVPGYNELSDEDQEIFNKTIIPFSQCQGKDRLINTRINHIERRESEEGIRVYLTEYGKEEFQYFYKNEQWG